MSYRILGRVLAAALMAGVLGCAAMSERGVEKNASVEEVSLSDVPTPARTTIERLIAGGEIRRLEREEAGGKVIYDVEAKVGEKDVEYDVASDGTVLTAEESVPYASLPKAVQATTEKYFGSAAGLKASKEVENGGTFYEVEGKKKGGVVALKLTDAGRIVEEEKQ